ncbi:MAG: protein kinase domain-containing protein [Candidatus Acidiferrales bacterium]
MTPEQWHQVKEILASTLEQPPAGRDAFLVRICPDTNLRREVESLIAAHGDSATAIFEQTAFSDGPASPLPPGALLGPYRIEARIGAGGMGEVFRATDTRLRRTVAVKLLPRGRSDPADGQRLLKEARAASALNHPNIVSIHDISSHQGKDFLVMEYVEGRTLKELIAEKTLLLSQVLDFGAQIASALDAAHEAGIVHRDIKPTNVVVRPNQQIKVLDFGLAKMTVAYFHQQKQASPDLTDAGTIVGTVNYMSPEQTRGEAVDPRSDIFSLGCVLYEAATGRLPFTGRSILEIMHEIATAVPPPPSRVQQGLPAAFDRLVTKCLEKEPAQRFARASEVSQAIKSFSLPDKAASLQLGGSRRTVAVVPLQFRNAVSEDRFLSVALADAIANRLGSGPALVVRPISSLMKYAGKNTDWTRIARELNVDLVVEGSIQKMGHRVRVLVQVWQFHDERALHAAKLDGDMGDLFTLQDHLADSVFDSLAPRAPDHTPRSARITPPSTRHPLAFELYMRAVDQAIAFNKFELTAAVEMLERALDIDPNFADAWGMLSTVCYHMGAHLDPDPKWFDQSERAIARTLELDPVNCDALCARGMIQWSPSRGFQFRPALRALNAALKINPSRHSARAHRGALLFHMGFHEAALEDYDEAIIANPQFALSFAGRSHTALYMGDYSKACQVVDEALALQPALIHANIISPLPWIYTGELKTARERLKIARQMFPDEPQMDCMESMILAREGDFRRAEQITDLAVAFRRSLIHAHHSWHCAAGVYAMCGKPEKALAELKRCAEGGLPNHRAFEKDPHLKTLHSHLEFIELIRHLRHDYEVFRQDFELSEVYAAT